MIKNKGKTPEKLSFSSRRCWVILKNFERIVNDTYFHSFVNGMCDNHKPGPPARRNCHAKAVWAVVARLDLYRKWLGFSRLTWSSAHVRQTHCVICYKSLQKFIKYQWNQFYVILIESKYWLHKRNKIIDYLKELRRTISNYWQLLRRNVTTTHDAPSRK